MECRRESSSLLSLAAVGWGNCAWTAASSGLPRVSEDLLGMHHTRHLLLPAVAGCRNF
jgi:hypothetical protein